MVGLVDGDSVKKATKEGFKTSLVILLAISLHAILAGVSMGIQSESENVYTVFVAIASHKAPAAFSIGSKFIRNGMDAKTVVSLIVVFSLVTPVGIIIGFLVGSTSAVARLVLEGLAAGTFIYIGATEVTADEFEMTARACSKLHSGAAAGAATVHTHKTHEVPGWPRVWSRSGRTPLGASSSSSRTWRRTTTDDERGKTRRAERRAHTGSHTTAFAL